MMTTAQQRLQGRGTGWSTTTCYRIALAQVFDFYVLHDINVVDAGGGVADIVVVVVVVVVKLKRLLFFINDVIR